MANENTSPLEERVTTGIEGLDNVLCGGFPQNRVYLIEGNPGSGKTTLALSYLMEGRAQGESCLYVTLSETSDELRSVAKSHGWSLEGIELFELGPTDDEAGDSQDQYTFFHPSEVELGQTTKAVLDVVERAKPKRVVFDSLSEMRLLARDPLRYRRQILALKHFFIGRECTVLFLDDRTSDVGDLQLQSLVHGAVMLEQLSPEYGAERRRLRVVKLRGVKYRGGFHDFVIQKGGLQVFPRLVSAEHHQEFEKRAVLSGVTPLDALLGGGLPKGSSSLFMGPAGCGKSSVSMQYAVAAMGRGEKASVFCFDEGFGSLFTRARGFGIDLESFVKKGLLLLHQVDPAELSPGEFVSRVKESVEKQKASVVIIDSLNGYLNAMPEERFLIIQLHELLSYLNQQGATTILICAQHGLFGTSVAAPIDASYLADNVVLFRFYEMEGCVKKAISVVKKRSGPHESSIRELILGKNGVEVSPPMPHIQGILAGLPFALDTDRGRIL